MLRTIALALALTLLPTHPTPAAPRNIVFILIDDLGYMDIGANNPGTFYETPNVDRIAAEGTRFTRGYAANPVCSPTRYSIMTGKYPSRIDATNFFSGKREGKFLPGELFDRMPVEELTLAEALGEAGYRTCFAGKWHLGPSEEFWPENQGFEVNAGGGSNGLPRSYFRPFKNVRSMPAGPEGEHLPERLAAEAANFIATNKNHPFLLYFSMYSVHTPLQAKPELIEKYEAKAAKLASVEEEPEFGPEEQVWEKNIVVRNGKRTAKPPGERLVRIRQRHAKYAAMMESMDDAVGRILAALDENGLERNTAVFFTSDNGGLSTSEGSPTSNLPLRGGKGWLYEGGIREPFLIKIPGLTQPGSVCHHPVISTDFYPTILEAAGLQLKPRQHLDGVSLFPLLEDASSSLGREWLFWHYPHYSNQGGFPGGAVREGDFKLVERFEDGRVHLYNTADDIGEKTDLAESMPERVNAMRRKLHTWYREVDAKFLRAKGDEGSQPWRP